MRTISALAIGLLVCSVAAAFDPAAVQEALDSGETADAVTALQEAAVDSAVAARMLASLHQRGEGVPKDIDKALVLYRRAAEMGDAEAQFNLGNIYLLGEGVRADDAWALTYYRAAARQGHPLARRNMDQLYRAAGLEPPVFEVDEPVIEPGAPEQLPADEPEVVVAPAVEEEPLAPATKLGIESAPAISAPPAAESEVVQSTETATTDVSAGAVSAAPEAAPVVAESATEMVAGEPEAETMNEDERAAIQMAQDHGVNVALNDAQAAAMTSDPDLQQLRQAVQQLPQDEQGAIVTIRTLADSGYPAAQFEMARLNLAGQGMTQNVPEAVSWLGQAADGGHVQAQFDLGNRYLIGAGVEPDDAMGITWLREAARGGHAEAIKRLGSIYEQAGLPMPDLVRPPQQAPTRQMAAANAIKNPKAETESHEIAADRAIEQEPEPVQVEEAETLDQTVTNARQEVAEVAVNEYAAMPEPEPEPYVEQRYDYAVVDHTGATLPKANQAEINPPRPDNHDVVSGGSLAQAVKPVTVAAPEVIRVANAVEDPVRNAPVAVVEPAVETLDEIESSEPPSVQAPESHESDLDETADEIAEAAATTASNSYERRGAGAIDRDPSLAASSESAEAEDTVQKRKSFFGRIADALTSEETQGGAFVSRAPGGGEAVAASTVETAVDAVETTAPKLAIAEPAEPNVVEPMPTLEQAKAALNAQDYARAADMFGRLAESGDAEAQAHFGYMNYQGEGVPRDKAEAVRWYRKSAIQGNRDAQYNLAVAYAFGEGVSQDDAEAVTWYRRAAEQGSAIAQYSLGVSYALGEGVETDDAVAARWYEAAAEQGYPAAQYNLAYMHRAGKGVEQNDSEALRWFLQAAQNGHASAQYSLGYMYRSAKGVARNIDEAIRWYRLAAAQGHPEARADLASLVPDSKPR